MVSSALKTRAPIASEVPSPRSWRQSGCAWKRPNVMADCNAVRTVMSRGFAGDVVQLVHLRKPRAACQAARGRPVFSAGQSGRFVRS